MTDFERLPVNAPTMLRSESLDQYADLVSSGSISILEQMLAEIVEAQEYTIELISEADKAADNCYTRAPKGLLTEEKREAFRTTIRRISRGVEQVELDRKRFTAEVNAIEEELQEQSQTLGEAREELLNEVAGVKKFHSDMEEIMRVLWEYEKSMTEDEDDFIKVIEERWS